MKNEVVTVDITDLGYNGEGVGRLADGKTVFVNGVLPGERAEIKIIFEKKDFSVGKLCELKTVSQHRISPECPFFPRCGGCTLCHLEYEEQLRYKQTSVVTAFKKVGIDIELPPIVRSPKIWGYRNKLSLPIANGKIGFYVRNTHDIVDIDNCLLQPDWSGKLIELVREYATKENSLRHLVVRELGGSLCITIVSRRKINLKGFERRLENYFSDFSLYNNVNRRDDNVILGDEYFAVRQAQPVIVDGLKINVHPAAFFQVNDGIRNLLYEEVIGLIGEDEILDAYCGAGVLSAKLARRAKFVYGAEIVPEAVESARCLAKDNEVKNVEFFCGDCAELVPTLSQKKGISTVVLDPPRAGCDRRVIARLNDFKPQKIVYVSCNSATLTRDIAALDGYEISSIKLFDMFPMTGNVECVVLMSRVQK